MAILGHYVIFPGWPGVRLVDTQLLELRGRAHVQCCVWPEAGQKCVGQIPVAPHQQDVARLQPLHRHANLRLRDERLAAHHARVAHDGGHDLLRLVNRLVGVLQQPPLNAGEPRAYRAQSRSVYVCRARVDAHRQPIEIPRRKHLRPAPARVVLVEEPAVHGIHGHVLPRGHAVVNILEHPLLQPARVGFVQLCSRQFVIAKLHHKQPARLQHGRPRAVAQQIGARAQLVVVDFPVAKVQRHHLGQPATILEIPVEQPAELVGLARIINHALFITHHSAGFDVPLGRLRPQRVEAVGDLAQSAVVHVDLPAHGLGGHPVQRGGHVVKRAGWRHR